MRIYIRIYITYMVGSLTNYNPRTRSPEGECTRVSAPTSRSPTLPSLPYIESLTNYNPRASLVTDITQAHPPPSKIYMARYLTNYNPRTTTRKQGHLKAARASLGTSINKSLPPLSRYKWRDLSRTITHELQTTNKDTWRRCARVSALTSLSPTLPSPGVTDSNPSAAKS